jgi:cyclopropane fatty-acyl-phospholipid synthase-like methyltransferase
MVDFKIDQKYDAILSLFDSVNHLMDFEDWKRMFKSVQSHLADNGVFIFDVNTPEKLERVAHDEPFIKEFDGNKMEMTVHDEGNGVVNWKVRYFEGGSSVAQEENIKEIAFPTEEIKKALAEVFSVVEIKEEANPETNVIERVYFSCKK